MRQTKFDANVDGWGGWWLGRRTECKGLRRHWNASSGEQKGPDAKLTESAVGNELMARGGGEGLRQRKCDATVDSCGGKAECKELTVGEGAKK